jgi:hypothetical protein
LLLKALKPGSVVCENNLVTFQDAASYKK